MRTIPCTKSKKYFLNSIPQKEAHNASIVEFARQLTAASLLWLVAKEEEHSQTADVKAT